MSSTREFANFLTALVTNRIYDPVMVWGPPGVGKSNTISNVAKKEGLQLIDVRISQITPADLRGLPAPNLEEGTFGYLPPDFLPKPGSPAGILFLDEITQAPPAVQAVTQQLILDRCVGSYKIPDNWFIWAAGNRQQDKTSVYNMPTALANRFHHVDVGADFDTWKMDYALGNIDDTIISFLSLRPELLHKMQVDSTAWPSPRSWSMADRLHKAGLDIGYAVGSATASEFNTFIQIYTKLPDLDKIADGNGNQIEWPKQEDLCYATAVGLQSKCLTANKEEILHIMKWLAAKGRPEYSLRVFNELVDLGTERVPSLVHLLQRINRDADLKLFMQKSEALYKAADN